MSNEFEKLEEQLLDSPAARARFLADTVEILENNGIDPSGLLRSIDLTDGARFLGGLAASTVVITRSSTGRGLGDPGTAASSVVVTRSSTGRGLGDPGTAAASLVITRSSTGRGLGDPGTAAASLVITRSSTGRGLGDPGTAASSVVITRSSTGLLRDIAGGLRQISELMDQEVGAIEERLVTESGQNQSEESADSQEYTSPAPQRSDDENKE